MSTSAAQLAANRANAAHSTGPRTPQGKARSSQNARTHGISTYAHSLIRLEDCGELESLKAESISFYRPETGEELSAVERIVLAKLSILRAARFEVGVFVKCLNDAFDHIGNAISTPQHRSFILADGIHTIPNLDKTFALSLRYQAQAERLYRRAVEDLARLQRLRANFPNEPVPDPEPDESKPLTPPPNEPIPTAPDPPPPDPAPSPANPAPVDQPLSPANPTATVGHAVSPGNPPDQCLRAPVVRSLEPCRRGRRQGRLGRRRYGDGGSGFAARTAVNLGGVRAPQPGESW